VATMNLLGELGLSQEKEDQLPCLVEELQHLDLLEAQKVTGERTVAVGFPSRSAFQGQCQLARRGLLFVRAGSEE